LRADGTKVTAPRVSRTWLVVLRGKPLLLAERRGRDLTPLAGWNTNDVGAAIPALTERFHRLEVTTWDGRPARESAVASALIEAGFQAEGERLRWERPGTRA
jgi:hypothetical protein